MIPSETPSFLISGEAGVSAIGRVLAESLPPAAQLSIIRSKQNPLLETHIVEASGLFPAKRFVVRAASPQSQAEGVGRLQKEYSLLQDLELAAFCAPRPVAADFDPAERGFPLTVVSFIDGAGWQSASDWDGQRFGEAFQHLLSQLVSIREGQLTHCRQFLHSSKDYSQAEVDTLAAKVESFARSDFAREAALLLKNKSLSKPARAVLSHGDFHSENLLVADGCLWLIDWELASVQRLDDVLSRLYDWADFSPLLQEQRFDLWACEAFDLELEHFEFTRLYRALRSWLVFTGSPKFRSKPLAERNAAIIRDVLDRGILGRAA